MSVLNREGKEVLAARLRHMLRQHIPSNQLHGHQMNDLIDAIYRTVREANKEEDQCICPCKRWRK